MNRPNTAQMRDLAIGLLAHEASTGDSDECAAAARVVEKIFTRLASLLGASGARALLARSVKLASPDFPCLAQVQFDLEPNHGLAEPLLTCLRGQAPAAATQASVALFATLLALLATLIGESLTIQLLRTAWPAFDVRVRNQETM